MSNLKSEVIVIGGGLAGLAASVALTDAGFRVSLFERSPRLGGRATSYVLADGEHIDNCQHVTLGCCTNLENFYGRIGVGDKIRFHERLVFAEGSGRRGTIKLSRLPAPLHLVPSFIMFRLLRWNDKWAIARAMLHIIRNTGRPDRSTPISMLDWLKQQKQTQHAIDRFWRTVLVSALNEDLERIDANHGVGVFWKAFLSNPDGFRVGVPSIPLEDVYAPACESIERGGGQVHLRSGVSGLLFNGNRISGVRLENGNEARADFYISAMTFDKLLKILPDAIRNRDAFSTIDKLQVSPITSVHMWFDRIVMRDPFIAALDQTIQWVFNRNGKQVQVVISASRAVSRLSQNEIVERCRKELSLLLAEAAGAELLRSVVIRESAATFSPEPGSDRWRPPQRTWISNFVLAGDWTETGWPATMESAVLSGYRAAEAILEATGRPRRLVRPELPVGRLARWLSGA
jgi:squalene-associated FAD-dependent desaturase